jgi:Ca2+-binding RTX toxin-like protein
MNSQLVLGRARFGFLRAIRRGILLACAVGLITAPGAAAVTYPREGGNDFAGGAQGWQGTAASCDPSLAGVCSESNSWNGSQGNPPGSIEAQMVVYANAGDLFTASSTWRSPTFTATATGGGSLSLDRQLDSSSLASLQPTARYNIVLVDETAGREQSIGSQIVNGSSETTVSGGTTAFAAHTEVVPAGTLKFGHDYHLELRSVIATNSAIAGLTGTISLRFDNLALRLSNSGPMGSIASRGVRFFRHPISLRKFRKLAARINWAANVGSGPGGSVVPLRDCTIVGTPGADHIKGSRGNDVICGMGGNDTINGRGGHDIIDGGAGKDRLNGGTSGDVLAGLAGRDTELGEAGPDRIGGGAGNDRLSGGPARDNINGGSGIDRAIAARHDRVAKVERPARLK